MLLLPCALASIDLMDDDAATVSIAGTVDGDESGPVSGMLTVTQSLAAVQDTVITYTVGGTADAGSDFTAPSGTVTIPAGATSATIPIAVLDDDLAEGTETVSITLNAITGGAPGVTIDGGAASASIDLLDDEEFTKYYVVDNSGEIYEYQPDGTPVTNYATSNANSSPRGATTNIQGDTVWVVDASNRVFAYDSAGQFLGSWQADGVGRPEGIATDGTDIWVVDTQSDRVFRFGDAATVTSGSRSPTSSFAVHSNNANPRGITTDGTHLWVVDHSGASSQVYKYTVDGAFLGSWVLDVENKQPEGITIDPGNVNTIWIVDRRTKEIFQYNGATAWVSGNRTADVRIALQATNKDPRGIADPPPPFISPSIPTPNNGAVFPWPFSTADITSRNSAKTKLGAPWNHATPLSGLSPTAHDAVFSDLDFDWKTSEPRPRLHDHARTKSATSSELLAEDDDLLFAGGEDDALNHDAGGKGPVKCTNRQRSF